MQHQLQEIKRTYLGWDQTVSMLYEPRIRGDKSKIAVLLMHSDGNYLEFPPAIAVAQRGYTCLAANVDDYRSSLDHKVWQTARMMDRLRALPGIEKVLILGHSGGATMMSAYQAVAENGTQVLRGAEKIIPFDVPGYGGSWEEACANGAAGAKERKYTPADGVLLLDANFGNGIMTLLSLDPSVTDEKAGRTDLRDPSLDLYNPENGYNPAGCHYSEEFVRRFWRGQAERMNRLIDYCMERKEIIDRGEGLYEDDEPLAIPGGFLYAQCNKLFPQVPEKYFSHTKEAWPLIHKDGSVTNEIVHCLRGMRPGAQTTGKLGQGTLTTTVKTFLKSYGVRGAEDYYYDETGVYGVDVDSSYSTTLGNVKHIRKPILAMGMTGSYEYIAAEHIARRATSCEDLTVAFVEGASHNITTEYGIEKTPGQYGDTLQTCFDYVDDWIAERFL